MEISQPLVQRDYFKWIHSAVSSDLLIIHRRPTTHGKSVRCKGGMGAFKHFLLHSSQILFWGKKNLPSCLQGCLEGYIQISVSRGESLCLVLGSIAMQQNQYLIVDGAPLILTIWLYVLICNVKRRRLKRNSYKKPTAHHVDLIQ